eukprot:1025777-Prorocentrum_minimum.AAC.1
MPPPQPPRHPCPQVLAAQDGGLYQRRAASSNRYPQGEVLEAPLVHPLLPPEASEGCFLFWLATQENTLRSLLVGGGDALVGLLAPHPKGSGSRRRRGVDGVHHPKVRACTPNIAFKLTYVILGRLRPSNQSHGDESI